MSIVFKSADVAIPKFSKKQARVSLTEISLLENIKIKRLVYNFCSDAYLYNINQQFLKHNTYTDIITFDYSENFTVLGEIYISIERIKMNTYRYKTSFNMELNRVIIHGLLHLCGYKDKTKSGKQQMRFLENKYLLLFE